MGFKILQLFQQDSVPARLEANKLPLRQAFKLV